MNGLEDALVRLEAMVTQAEAHIRSLTEENERLRAALVREDRAEGTGASSEPRPIRLALLEAERSDVRARLRSVLQAIEMGSRP